MNKLFPIVLALMFFSCAEDSPVEVESQQNICTYRWDYPSPPFYVKYRCYSSYSESQCLEADQQSNEYTIYSFFYNLTCEEFCNQEPAASAFECIIDESEGN